MLTSQFNQNGPLVRPGLPESQPLPVDSRSFFKTLHLGHAKKTNYKILKFERVFRSFWGYSMRLTLGSASQKCPTFKCMAWLAFKVYVSPYEAYTPNEVCASVTLYCRGISSINTLFLRKEGRGSV